jgi:hypothetical protein
MFTFNRHNVNKRSYPTSNQQLPLASEASAIVKPTSEASSTVLILNKKSLYQRWSSMGRNKRMFTFYAGTVLCVYIFNTYKDGRQALMDHRTQRILNTIHNPLEIVKPHDMVQNEEFNAVVKGCEDYGGDRFVTSMIYPYTFVTSIIPHIVTLLNSHN